jgi:mannose-6-phosphate isomerase-like protein (cupin superfamily)
MNAATQTANRTAAEIVGAERRRFEYSQGPRIIGPEQGDAVNLGSLGVRFMTWSEESGGGFALVEHPIPPRTLCAPLHRHSKEDEYSYVLEGRLGALLGDDVVYAEPGDYVFKPRDQWHTFWNAGDEVCRILEIIAPGGFERFFAEWAAGADAGNLDQAELSQRYGIEFDLESVERLCEEHGLTLPLRS